MIRFFWPFMIGPAADGCGRKMLVGLASQQNLRHQRFAVQIRIHVRSYAQPGVSYVLNGQLRGSVMGKHNKARRSVRCGQIVVAAAAATVLAGWAAPVASADDTDAAAKPANPISKTADAVKSTVDGVRKAVTDAAGSFQKRGAGARIQAGSGGAGSLLTSQVQQARRRRFRRRAQPAAASSPSCSRASLGIPAIADASLLKRRRHGFGDHSDRERHAAGPA